MQNMVSRSQKQFISTPVFAYLYLNKCPEGQSYLQFPVWIVQATILLNYTAPEVHQITTDINAIINPYALDTRIEFPMALEKVP